jgi:NAD(P)-dependent dehydrogenase (short-subunit alcohol dehydrogenase family)
MLLHQRDSIMPRDLRDMVIIVTGASAGIGRALATRLAQSGARLALAARRLDLLLELNRALGNNHLCVATDVAESAQCAALIEQTVQHFGRLDTLVCNAGVGLFRPISQTTDDDFDAILRINLFGTLNCVRPAVAHMRTQPLRDDFRGQVMIVSSSLARRALPNSGAYAASKAAQLSLAESLRVELKPARIAVTSVHPIGTATDFFTTAELRSGAKHSRSLAEPVQPADAVARAMARAIRHPRPEVWPFAPARFALAFSTLLPSFTDWLLSRIRPTSQDQSDRP